MQKALFLLFILLFQTLCTLPLLAQQENPVFTVDLEIRPRFEIRNGFKAPMPVDSKPAAFTEQRSRVHLNYSSSDIAVRLVMQDVRIWGNHPQIYKNDPALSNLYEAWAEYNFTPDWNIRVGRQALNYDNARFLGDLDWVQQGRSHDALLLGYRGTWNVDAGFTWNQSNIVEPTHLTGSFYAIPGNHKSMQFLWMNRSWESTNLSLLLHNDGRQVAVDSSTAWRQTAGFYATQKTGDVTLRSEFYYQLGKDAGKKDVAAWMAHFEAQWKRYVVGLDYLSGTSLSSDGNNSFEPLYGTNHKFYGFMDYFHVGSPHRQPGNMYNTGLINLYQKASFPVTEQLTLHTHLHQFVSPVSIYDAQNQSMDAYLGTELDLMFTVRLAPQAMLTGGYSHMFMTDSMIRIKGGYKTADINGWAWVMLRIAPRVFSTK